MPMFCASPKKVRLVAAAPVFLLASLAMAQHGHGSHQRPHVHPDKPAAVEPAQKSRSERVGDPYPLETCPVTGMKLGSMGKPVVKIYDGREIRFCCGGCPEKFEADRAGYEKQIDRKIADQQRPYYPMSTCLASGEELPEDAAVIERVYGNRLVRLCCEMCADTVEKDPERHLKELDKAAVKLQRESYPLQTCVVAGGELGSMGEPVDLVLAGRLVRLCCAGCKEQLEAEPGKYLAKVDEAWAESGNSPGASGAKVGEEPDGHAGNGGDAGQHNQHGDSHDHGPHDHH